MKFKFSFQTLMNHRKNLERTAQKDFAEAQKKVDDALAEIQRDYDKIDNSRDRIRELQQQGGSHISEIRSLEYFIEGQKELVTWKRHEARQLMETAEEKREVLVEASKDYKTLENLKERHWQDFLKKKKKQEQKENDELVVMRFSRGKQNG